MKRKTIALLLALTMCLSLLSACGADSKPDGEPSTATTTPSPTEQPDEKEEQPTQQPEESAEPTQEPTAPTESESAVPAEMTYTFDTATGTLTCSGGGEITDEWRDAIKNALFETDFAKCSKELKKVVIEEGVSGIDSIVFTECKNLTEVVIPDSVVRIGNDAFRATGLVSVQLPDSITEIGEGVFSFCQNLSSVKLPDQLTEIPVGMFYACPNLTSIQIPDSVVSIGRDAFSGAGLTEIAIPDSVVSIDDMPFSRCPLKELTIPASVTEWNGDMFSDLDDLQEVTFLCEANMDNVEKLVKGLLKKPITIHAPAGSVIEGYINRQIESGNAKCTFEPIN